MENGLIHQHSPPHTFFLLQAKHSQGSQTLNNKVNMELQLVSTPLAVLTLISNKLRSHAWAVVQAGQKDGR